MHAFDQTEIGDWPAGRAALRAPRSVQVIALLATVVLCSISTSRGDEQSRSGSIVITSVKPIRSQSFIVDYGLTRDDLRHLQKQVGQRGQVVASRWVVQAARYGDRLAKTRLVGTTAEFATMTGIRMDRGRFLREKDTNNRNNVAVIDAAAAQQLFANDDPIGKNVRVGDHYFLIVGITGARTRANRTKPVESHIYIPLSTMRSRYGDMVIITRKGTREGERFQLSDIRITLADKAAVQNTATVIRRLLKQSHKTVDYSIKVSR